jgi:pyruvate dehydrogenase E2 component (dihydrolipoamide acetyltransferase)
MSEARATVPDFAVAVTIDMARAIMLAERADSSASVNDVIVRATAQAAVKHPKVNSSYRDGELELYERVNIGIAVATPDGLLVPVVKDVPRLELAELSARTSGLIRRARDGTISPPDLSGATLTVSNLGMYAATSFRGIINVPQAAILCVGAIEPRAMVSPDGGLLARPVATFTLVCDHRVLYGTDAAEFLSELKLILEAASSQKA